MARSRTAENSRSRPKSAQLEALTYSIGKFQEVLKAIDDFSQEGFPYRDAARAKAELQVKECVRHAFGERSQEFQTYRNFKLRADDPTETAQSIAIIKGLIQTLEDQKLDLQGLKPTPKSQPPSETGITNTARMVLVSPATQTGVTAQPTQPMTVTVAMTTNVAPSVSKTVPTPAPTTTPPPPQSNTVTPTIPVNPIPLEPVPQTPFLQPSPPEPSLPLAAAPAPSLSSPPQPLLVDPPATSPSIPPTHTPPIASEPFLSPAPMKTPIPMPILPQSTSVPSPPTPTSSTDLPLLNASNNPVALPTVLRPQPMEHSGIGATMVQPVQAETAQDPLQLVRKICLRFHAVARQLRLRKDYRQTLEVDDDYDLQDLLCALLKVEFDEVATDEWTPPYTGGEPRTMLLVDKDHIAVVAKKTKAGITPKELTDQVTADSAYFRAQGRCSILFCFLYDPEGRIGSPKRLETTLTSAGEHFKVEVLVAPK